jgi:PAS domain S-box-containing protein
MTPNDPPAQENTIILLVEDEAIVAMTEARMLEKHGFEVITVDNAQDAIETVQQQDIHLILMDIDLGHDTMDGTEAAKTILEEHDLPIVFLTSHAEKEMVDKVRNITRYGYVLKKSGEFVLLESINMAFQLFNANAHIREREQRYKALFFNNHSPMLLIQPDSGDIVDANPAACEFYGWSKEQLTHMKIQDINVLTDKKVLQEMDRAKKEKRNQFHFKHQRSDGAIRDVEVSASPIFVKNEHLLYSIIHDITEQKEAEKKVRDNEKRLQRTLTMLESTMNAIPDAIGVLDNNYNVISYNEAGYNLLNISPDEVYGKKCYELIHRDSPCNPCAVRESYRTKQIEHVDRYDADLDIWVDLRAYPILDEHGNVVQVIEHFRDITQRKTIENKLRKTNATLNTLFESSPQAIVVLDVEGKVTFWNKAAEQLFGWKAEEVKGHFIPEVPPDQMELVKNKLHKQMQGEETRLELKRKRKDGKQIDVWLSTAPLYDENGEVTGLMGMFEDITDRKRAEEELKKSEEKHRLFLENFNGIAYQSSHLTFEPFLFSGMVEEITGYTADDFLSTRLTWGDLIHPNDVQRTKNLGEQIRDEPGFVGDSEYRIIHRDGTIRWVRDIGRAIRGIDGKTHFIQGAIYDITDRKRAEEELRKKSEEQTLLLETMEAQAWYLFDIETYGMANNAHAAFIGMKREDIEYKRLNDIFPDSVAEVCKEGNRRVFESKQTIKTQEWIPNANGENRLIAITKTPRVNEQGEVEYVVCVGTDITELKQKEEKLTSLNAEKDFLMKELNHRVKNNLAMITSLINVKDDSLGPEIDLSDLKNQIDTIRIMHEKLFQTEKTTHLDIKGYIQDLLDTIFSSFSVKPVTLHTHIEKTSLSTKEAIPLGLIINEIATNAIKYGSSSEEMEFSVDLREAETGYHYVLTISNTGAPFPEDIDLHNPGTLGLNLVSALIKQLKGTIQLQRSPHPVFTITFPNTHYEQ